MRAAPACPARSRLTLHRLPAEFQTYEQTDEYLMDCQKDDPIFHVVVFTDPETDVSLWLKNCQKSFVLVYYWVEELGLKKKPDF